MSEIIEMDPKLRQATETLPVLAEAMEIQSNEGMQTAANSLLHIKRLLKQVAGFFDPIICKAHEAHKEALAQKKKAEAPLREAEGIIKPKIAAYSAEKERIRQEEEDAIRRQEAEVERKRQEEIRRVEEETRKAAELETAGKKAEAEALLKKAEEAEAEIPTAPAIPVAVPKTTSKLDGVSIRKIWKYEIKDASQIPREFMVPNETLIGQAVRSSKGQCTIPGVWIYSEDSVAAGR